MTSGAIEAALQKGIYATLTADTALTALLAGGPAGVTAAANPAQALPLILIAGTRCRAGGTQGFVGAECEVALEIYSRQAGGSEARQIAAVAADAIVSGLAIEGQVVTLCRLMDSETQLQNDGETYRARVVLRIYSDAEDAA